jgi:hypothetical protein
MDECTRRRWEGLDIDLGQPLPSDLILAAGEADPSIMGSALGYLGMTELPAALRAAEPRARAVYAAGWRPAMPPGPTRDELADIIERALGTAPALATASAG